MIIANIDGNQKVRLFKSAAPACSSVRVGDYLEAEGEKQNEQPFDATDLRVEHPRRS